MPPPGLNTFGIGARWVAEAASTLTAAAGPSPQCLAPLGLPCAVSTPVGIQSLRDGSQGRLRRPSLFYLPHDLTD